jgi:hypothetical protein
MDRKGNITEMMSKIRGIIFGNDGWDKSEKFGIDGLEKSNKM